MRADKYQDRFLDEYWAAWIRRVRRAGADDGHAAGDEHRARGQRRHVVRDIEPQELLLDFLRDRLGLTGAKRSCDVQVCGTCTVLVDGAARVSSCCFLAADADGREVLTIEGLRERPEFARLEDASRATPPSSVASARRACCSPWPRSWRRAS